MILDLAFVDLGIVAGAIAISTAIRLINGESWESANRFRTSEKHIILFGYFALGVLFALSAEMGFAVLMVLLGPAMIYLLRTSPPDPRSKPPLPLDEP